MARPDINIVYFVFTGPLARHLRPTPPWFYVECVTGMFFSEDRAVALQQQREYGRGDVSFVVRETAHPI